MRRAAHIKPRYPQPIVDSFVPDHVESFMASSMIKVRPILAPIAIFLTAAACTSVLETGPLSQTDGIACRSTAGGYYLPKVIVRLSVSRNDAPGRGFKLDNNTPAFQTVADRRHQPYCLDYLASPTAKDVIAVDRGTNGLLLKVASDTQDRSTEIALKLIDTAENIAKVALRARTLNVAGATETGDFTFDPFDPQEMAEINRALRRFGFCAYIENHSFPDEYISPQAWCSDPAQERYVNQYNVMLASTPAALGAMNTGILYRPNANHKLVVWRKSNPGSREPWALFLTKNVDMPNVSPIFSIGVQRAFFANRATELTFANGVLTNIKINKTSELENFSKIPLALAQAIVRLPTEIVQLRIDDTTNATTLASKQIDLANALSTLAQTSQANPQVPGVNRTMNIEDRQNQDMQHCLDQGGSSDFCRTRILGKQK
jgi:hypothetical protein